jgi:hypothetical protein
MKIWHLAWCLLLVTATSFAESRQLSDVFGSEGLLWGRGRRTLALPDEAPDPTRAGLSQATWKRNLLDTVPGTFNFSVMSSSANGMRSRAL